MTDIQPLISIVVPTYNHAEYLKAAIDSVLKQTYKNWELVIVNNFSDDNTVQIVSSYTDHRIVLINFENHGIIASSRNEGIRRATGEYVAFLDSDDTWKPEKLAKCTEELLDGNDLVCHGEVWTEIGKPPRDVIYGPSIQASYNRLLFQGNCISTSATVVRRKILELLEGFDERREFNTAEDYDLWMRISQKTNRIAFIPLVLGEFRRHNKNASNSVIHNLSAELAVVEDHFSRQKNSTVKIIRRRQRHARAYYGAARTLDSAGNPLASLKYFFKSFLTSPFIARLYPAFIIMIFHSALARARQK